ncbi:PAS domain-containing hybrid sensor histidine kinase/response regulator [Sporobolomyces salmoneus]|uniref:PAS domain-containing hybrid sensor histidine kinase/response regulator n=1 Tax=Sporobolomyces salmoneus TaxID=183962 RepID=UPI0031784988
MSQQFQSDSSLGSIPSSLLDYLDDLALPACVIAHSTLLGATNTLEALLPAYQNPALKSLLSEGSLKDKLGNSVNGHGKDGSINVEGEDGDNDEAHKVKAYLRDALDEPTRNDFCDWLIDGVRTAINSKSSTRSPTSTDSVHKLVRTSSAFSPSRPRLHRDRSLQLSTDVSFAKLYWRASHCGNENDGYTVLTQLPIGHLAVRSSWNDSKEKSDSNGGDDRSNSKPLRHVRFGSDKRQLPPGKIMIGAHEVDAERAKDPNTIEGMAYTLFHAPIGIFRVNTDLSITFSNPSWRNTCGISEGDSNDSWPSRIYKEDREGVVQHYSEIAQALPIKDDAYEFRWEREGSKIWASCVISPAIIDGKMSGYTGFLGNISKHKDAATAAQRREEQLQSELAVLSSSATVGLARIDLDGKMQTVNKAWMEMTSLGENEPLDNWKDRVHPEDSERVLKAWHHAVKNREPLTLKFRFSTGDVVLGQVQLNHSDRAFASGWIASLINVTAESKAEEAVLNLLKEREASAVKAAEDAEERRKVAVEEKHSQELLIDVVSHELRGPVSAILQNADMSRSSFQNILAILKKLKEQSKLPPELDGKLLESLGEDIESMDAIHECASAQERIANDILGLAQIQLNKYSISPVEFDLATSLRNIARMFKTESRAKGIELKLVIGSSLARLGPRARVLADPARLTQILVNLLSNAIRFTAKSAIRRVTLAVEVSATPPEREAALVPPKETEYQIDKRKPVYLFFSVEDTGPGMTPEETRKLFNKFMQASPFTHTTWGGSGLGLWIARNLCELQAGRIEVASTVGEGSIFRCFITARSVDRGLKQDDSRAIPVIEGITAPNASRGEAPRVFLSKPEEDSAPLNGFKVLCCEDNQINRTVLKRQLVKEGVTEVLLACDGQEGIDMLYERPVGAIDCILMDIEMPVLDGLAATRKIRLDEEEGRRTGHQRIVGLTGNARSAQKEAALEAGMDLVVTKPYKVPELIAKIRNNDSPSIQPPPSPTPSDRSSTSASEPGRTTETEFIPHSDLQPDSVTKTKSGAFVETISSLEAGGGPEQNPEEIEEEVANSMHRHGDGQFLPASVPNPEEEVERERERQLEERQKQ